MRVLENGVYRDMTPEEIAREEQAALAEREYWQSVSYDEAVDAEIRKRYSVSQELAAQRQEKEKPEEYAAYYAYCEECKAFVKAKKQEVENEQNQNLS